MYDGWVDGWMEVNAIAVAVGSVRNGDDDDDDDNDAE